MMRERLMSGPIAEQGLDIVKPGFGVAIQGFSKSGIRRLL
jgi:hypothetical protein